MKRNSPKKILAAITPSYIPAKLTQALDDDFELVFCTSLDHARALLHEPFDLVICDTHFDDCRMFDMLRVCKLGSSTRGIPFLCMRVVEGELDETLYQSVDIASKALGAAEFVDLFRLKRKCGEEEAYRQLRSLVELIASGAR